MGTKRKQKLNRFFFLAVPLAIFLLITLAPFYWILVTALKTSTEVFAKPLTYWPVNITFDNFVNLFKKLHFEQYFINSFIVSISVTTLVSVMALIGGYAMSRYKFRGKSFVYVLLLCTQMFPAVMKIIPYYKILVSLHLNNTRTGLLIVYASFSIPFCTWMMYGYFKSIPTGLDEAARVDGSSAFHTFYRIIMPIALPGLVATVIYAFLQNWNEYMFASVLMSADEKKTITYAISTMADAYKIQWNYLMCAAMISSVPTLAVFTVMQKYLIAGMTAGAVKE